MKNLISVPWLNLPFANKGIHNLLNNTGKHLLLSVQHHHTWSKQKHEKEFNAKERLRQKRGWGLSTINIDTMAKAEEHRLSRFYGTLTIYYRLIWACAVKLHSSSYSSQDRTETRMRLECKSILGNYFKYYLLNIYETRSLIFTASYCKMTAK